MSSTSLLSGQKVLNKQNLHSLVGLVSNSLADLIFLGMIDIILYFFYLKDCQLHFHL